jgi:vacuolar-type H+-ATPase subunit I/STV1
MNCGFIDPVCWVQNGLWELWNALPWYVQGLYIAGVIAVLGGIIWSFTGLLRAIGGWPAVAGVGAVILATVLALIPRKPKGRQHEPIENVDEETSAVRRKPSTQKPPPGKRVRTIWDQLGRKP